MVPGSIGLTDEELAALEAQHGQPEITTGLVDRLAASPAPAQGFTDRELDVLPTLASTPFARERGIALPPEAPAEPEPMTDYELNQLEEENYRRVDYIMPQEEFRQYWTRRTEENNEVGRFIEGVGQGAAGMLAMIPEAGREIRDGMVGMVTDPVNQVQRNVQTGAETIRKAGINMVQLFDWVGNKVDDATTWAKRRGLKHQALAKRLEQEGRLTGDELQDANIIAAAASEADAMEPTPVENEEDFDKAYDRYQREKALEQEFAGVTDFQVGASKMAAPATSKEAYQITNEQPAETLSMIGSMALDPVNLVPLGAGALSKLRVLRRTATLAGAPLRGVQRAADATADLAERMEFGISSRVQDITGLTAKQQAALGAGAAGAAVYADAAGGGGNVTAAVTALGSVLPGLRYGGAIIRKTGAAAGGAATIIREAGVGGIGTARAEAAADLARMTAIPERYRKYFTGYVDGTDSTLKRVAQDAGNPEALRRVARFADRAGVTTAARLADDVTSGAVAAGITGAPFAALQPDAERAGEVFGGIMALGGVGGLVGGAIGRRSTAPDADVARMMADVYAVGGNVDALSALPHASLDRMAAMQGVLAGKVDFVPLKADEYRMNKDVSATGGELAAGLFLEKDANGRARVFINLDARKSAGGVGAIVPHEIGHAILTSNILDGQPRNDLRNLVNQQYGADGVQARGREYVARLVDSDINNGTTGELPQVLTEQEFRDLESGNKSAADISKARKLEPSERERLINERYEELSQQSIERGEDALDWARDEVIAETFASEAPAIDFRAIRRDGAFPRLAESMLAAGGRVLEVMGVRLDGGTGKMLDNPSVLFRNNPLFQDRIMQKRVKEYVRAYDQYLVGLEEAGSATPRGVELARSSRPEDMARSTHVKLRDEGRGVLENDFLFQKPDGTYSYKPQPIINAAEANRAAQIKTLYDAKKFVPVNSTEFGKRKVNGREVIGGPVLPPQFDLFTHFPKHVREQARMLEAGREDGSTYYIDYNRIGTGASGRYRILNMGNVRAIQTESSAPFGWLVSKANHLLAAGIDINAFRASAMKAINKGELGIFNNDMKQVEADLKTYLANHHNGLPGEATIGQQKRDTLNGLIGTGTAVQRAANPLYAELNPRGSIRTWRIDRLNDAQPSGRTGYFFDYDKINNNRMPQQIPRGAQGMPDAAASGRGDGMSEQWDLYGERLRDDVESWSPARDTGKIDYDMMDVVDSFVDFARKNSQLAGDDLAKAFYRAESPTALQRKKLNAALENVGQPPRAAAPRAQAMPDSLESAPTDQLLRQYEENQGYLGLSTLGMREGRPVRGGAAQTRELLRRNDAISAELERRGVRSEDAQLQRALQRRGQAMPDAAITQDGFVQAPEDAPTFKLPQRAMAQFMPDAGVNLADYADRTILALPADRMGIGSMRVGPRGSERELSVKGQGGAGFMEIYNGGGWAFSDEATGNRFMKRLREAAEPGEGSVLVGITAMSEFNHLKNQTGQLAYVEALEAAIAGKSISKRQADAHIKAISQSIMQSTAKSVTDSTRRKFAAIKNLNDFAKAVRNKSLNFADAAPYSVQIARKALPIPYKEAKDIGIAFDDIGKQTADPRYADVPFGTVVALLEVPLEQAPMRSDFHYSYPFKVTGRSIGFLKKYYDVGQLTSDPRIRNSAGAVQAQPLQTVLPKLDRIGKVTRGQAMPDAGPADAPPFYMKSAQVLDAKIQGKAATADQVRAILKNPQNGIKAEELKWTGIEQAVERIAKENGGKVPKEALLRYLQEDGAVRLEEVTLKESGTKRNLANEEQLGRLGYSSEVSEDGLVMAFMDLNDPSDLMSAAEMRQFGLPAEAVRLAETIEQSFYGSKGSARYGSYQLPGGENYREVVLAMPVKPISKKGQRRQFIDQRLDAIKEMAKQLEPLNGVDPAAKREMARLEAEYAELAAELKTIPIKEAQITPEYTSPHFDAPNYVAHMRLNERTDAAGKPGLFLEEIQSDRHQAGREKGYLGEGNLAARKAKVDQWNALMDEVGRREEAGERAHTHPELAALVKQADDLGNTIPEVDFDRIKDTGIPDAPFRKDWPMQMFKRALADAVGSGKEWIGWTTGETQARRYDLSKQVDSVNYDPFNKKLVAVKDGQRVLEQGDVPKEKLADYIGKDAASKLLEPSTLNGAGNHVLSGDGLKVGGEGMKGFYDQILPKEISKYVKQWGAQVEKAQAATRATIDTPQALEAVRYIRRQGGVAASSRSMEQAAKVNALLAQLERRMSKDRVNFADAWTEIPASTAKSDLKSVLGFRGIKGIASLEEIKSVPIWRVNITPQMRESIKKAGQALFVGGAAAVVAEDQLEQ